MFACTGWARMGPCWHSLFRADPRRAYMKTERLHDDIIVCSARGKLLRVLSVFLFSMSSDSGSSASSASESEWTENQGSSTDDDAVVPAHQSLRGRAALVTASCPRKYPRTLEARRRQMNPRPVAWRCHADQPTH